MNLFLINFILWLIYVKLVYMIIQLINLSIVSVKNDFLLIIKLFNVLGNENKNLNNKHLTIDVFHRVFFFFMFLFLLFFCLSSNKIHFLYETCSHIQRSCYDSSSFSSSSLGFFFVLYSSGADKKNNKSRSNKIKFFSDLSKWRM